jgi:hypothetical protein
MPADGRRDLIRRLKGSFNGIAGAVLSAFIDRNSRRSDESLVLASIRYSACAWSTYIHGILATYRLTIGKLYFVGYQLRT